MEEAEGSKEGEEEKVKTLAQLAEGERMPHSLYCQHPVPYTYMYMYIHEYCFCTLLIMHHHCTMCCT